MVGPCSESSIRMCLLGWRSSAKAAGDESGAGRLVECESGTPASAFEMSIERLGMTRGEGSCSVGPALDGGGKWTWLIGDDPSGPLFPPPPPLLASAAIGDATSEARGASMLGMSRWFMGSRLSGLSRPVEASIEAMLFNVLLISARSPCVMARS